MLGNYKDKNQYWWKVKEIVKKVILITEGVVASELRPLQKKKKKLCYQSAVLWRDQFYILWIQNKQTGYQGCLEKKLKKIIVPQLFCEFTY